MVDFDLSMLYGVQNKRLNEQVKRNKERFPDDFMFQLTQEEWNTLRSQIATAKQLGNEKNSNLKSQIATSSWGGVRKRPYAFTRNGIAMLSSVLRSETAVDVNIRIMRAFTSIPQIANNNALERVVLLIAKQDGASEFLTQAIDGPHRILVCSMERLFFCCLVDGQSFVIVIVECIEGISVISHYFEKRIGFIIRQQVLILDRAPQHTY